MSPIAKVESVRCAPPPRVYAALSNPLTRKKIKDADQLQFRGNSLASLLIRTAGRGVHSHSAKAGWWHDKLMCVEIREWLGGRAVSLESQVALHPGRIDVYRANRGDRHAYDRAGALAKMIEITGRPYGRWHIVKVSLAHLPLVRLFTYVSTDDFEEPAGQPFCSEATSIADRLGGGVDPVANLADRMTEPSDVSRSLFYEYMMTLVPDEETRIRFTERDRLARQRRDAMVRLFGIAA